MRRVLFFYIFLFIIFGIPLSWYAWPKSMPHPMSPDIMKYIYRGFDLNDGASIFGKQWSAVTLDDNFDGSHWRVEFKKEGYNPYKIYYSDGTLQQEGACLIEVIGFENGPYPDFYDVRWAKCYRPDGSLGSEVIDGTGTYTLWMQDGTKAWELKLVNYQRTAHTKWYPSGQLHGHQEYKDGSVHGPLIVYYPSGAKKTEGDYDTGLPKGDWIRYNEDGSINSVEPDED